MRTKTLSPEQLHKMDAYWRAANYLSVGQIYLYDNPLLKRPLTLADVKHMLLGHWGTTPGQNFIYVHLNRVIKKYNLDMIYVSGPGHGGPAVVGNTYLEGTYSEIYPDISQDEAGLRKLFLQFSFPGGIPSHASPECPGSIHEGGELGYSLSHSFGAVFDNPDLVVACVVGDGEAETGPLATAWHSNKFLENGLLGLKRIPFEKALRAPTTHRHDYLNAYVSDLGNVIDMDAIRAVKISMGVDPLGGAGVRYWGPIAERYGLDLTVVNEAVDPTFRFMTVDWDGHIRMDPFSPYAMQRLIGLKDRFEIAFACDTDHDRHGIVTRSGGLLAPNHYLSVAIFYLFQHRPKWRKGAAVGKTVVSSQMIDRVTAKLGRKLYEAPVGFKWFVDGLLDGSLGFGGEDGGSMSISTQALAKTVAELTAPGKGILAADESDGTIEKRFKAVNVASTEEARRDYRELLFSTPGLGGFISGVILFEETLKQKNAAGVPLPALLKAQGIVPGIKVDKGTVLLPNFPGETVTQGLDGLAQRLSEYKQLGARFAKWRALINIGAGIPTPQAIASNAHALARYAAICQELALVPIVEPEVLMDGDHTLATSARVTEEVLHAVFHALHLQRVALEYMILKPNMVEPGRACPEPATPQQVAQATLICLRRTVPAAVPGINFLSGGQSETTATANLHALNATVEKQPWVLSFSYGRALQASVLQAWRGEAANKSIAQQALYKRARLNSAATQGKYTAAMENE